MSAAQDTGAAQRLGASSFSLGHRLRRLAWTMVWTGLAKWTPRPCHAWRRAVLRAFGARIDRTARIYGGVEIWWPEHLTLGAHATLGPRVICYNVAPITIGDHAIISQGAHLCAATHDVDDPAFPLRTRPISVLRNAWVAAEAFVGPGVTMGEGAVLGARGVAFRDLAPWTIHAGNPARLLRRRRVPDARDIGSAAGVREPG